MSASGRSPLFRGAVAGALVMIGTTAHAQSAADKALAESLFREGRSLMAAGQTHEGCVKLEGSYRIDAKTGTLTNLAACHELEGKTASAWAEFTEAAARAASAKRANLEQLARARAAELEPKLARIAMRLPASRADVRVTLDGRPLVAEALDTAIPVDPGPHEIVATRGEATWSSTVTVERGPDRIEVVVPELTAPPPAPVVAMPAPLPPSPPPPTKTSTRRLVTYGVFGAAGLGLAAGAILGLQAIAKKNDADALCSGAICASQQGVDLHEEARTRATWSTAGFAVGLAAAAVGIYLLVTEPRRAPSLAGRF